MPADRQTLYVVHEERLGEKDIDTQKVNSIFCRLAELHELYYTLQPVLPAFFLFALIFHGSLKSSLVGCTSVDFV